MLERTRHLPQRRAACRQLRDGGCDQWSCAQDAAGLSAPASEHAPRPPHSAPVMPTDPPRSPQEQGDGMEWRWVGTPQLQEVVKSCLTKAATRISGGRWDRWMESTPNPSSTNSSRKEIKQEL